MSGHAKRAGDGSEGNVIDYFQNRFDDAQKALRKDGLKARILARLHRWLAYGLKAVAIFGGIAIAAGLNELWSHVMGIMIAVTVGIDLLLQNFNRLLAVQDASNAYEELYNRVKRQHVSELGKVMKLRSGGDEEGAKRELIQMFDNLIDMMHAKMTEIEVSWRAADRVALQTLSMEQKKA